MTQERWEMAYKVNRDTVRHFITNLSAEHKKKLNVD